MSVIRYSRSAKVSAKTPENTSSCSSTQLENVKRSAMSSCWVSLVLVLFIYCSIFLKRLLSASCFLFDCRLSTSAAKPSRPEGPLFPEEIRDKHVKLKWKKPEDDGGMPVSDYVIEKMDMDTGIWEPAGVVS